MLREILSRQFRPVMDALSAHGIKAHSPVGGSLFGTLDLPNSLTLRVDAFGNAMIYDPRQGTLNKRIPLKEWKVREGAVNWTNDVLFGICEYLNIPNIEPVKSISRTKPVTTALATPTNTALKQIASKLTDDDALKMFDLLGAGTSINQIAQEFNRSNKIIMRMIEGILVYTKERREPYYQHLDPQRLQMLNRRDELKLSDDETVVLQRLRKRLCANSP